MWRVELTTKRKLVIALFWSRERCEAGISWITICHLLCASECEVHSLEELHTCWDETTENEKLGQDSIVCPVRSRPGSSWQCWSVAQGAAQSVSVCCSLSAIMTLGLNQPLFWDGHYVSFAYMLCKYYRKFWSAFVAWQHDLFENDIVKKEDLPNPRCCQWQRSAWVVTPSPYWKSHVLYCGVDIRCTVLDMFLSHLVMNLN